MPARPPSRWPEDLRRRCVAQHPRHLQISHSSICFSTGSPRAKCAQVCLGSFSTFRGRRRRVRVTPRHRTKCCNTANRREGLEPGVVIYMRLAAMGRSGTATAASFSGDDQIAHLYFGQPPSAIGHRSGARLGSLCRSVPSRRCRRKYGTVNASWRHPVRGSGCS